MNPTLRTAISASVLGIALCFTANSHAATVSTNGFVVDNDVPPLGADGYYFPYLDPVGGGTINGSDNGNGTDITSLPSYISNLTINATQRYTSGDDNGFYSDITLNGIGYNTGLAYNFTAPGGSLLTATITVGAGVPSGAFQLGILGDNPDAGGHSGSWTVASSNSATATTVGAVATNNFYLFDITNAVQGDVITITSSAGTANIAAIGGLTFDSVPEPASVALLGMGAVLLGGFRRRRA